MPHTPRPILAAAVAVACLAGHAQSDAVAASPATRPADVAVDHADFDALLAKYVDPEGLVNYLEWRRDDYPALAAYLDAMKDIDPSRLDRDERLALYINVYNATMIRAVMDRYSTDWNPKRGDGTQPPYAIFKEKLVHTNGRDISLDDLEHTLIRAGFAEPRIHAALVCGARDCPPLKAEAFTGDNVQAMLESNMRGWIADPARSVADAEAKTLRVSGLFYVYAADFGGLEKVPAYVNQYSDLDLDEWQVTFEPSYNWSVNIASPAEGEWAAVTTGGPVVESADGGATVGESKTGDVLEVIGRRDDRVQVKMPFGGQAGWVDATSVEPFEPTTKVAE